MPQGSVLGPLKLFSDDSSVIGHCDTIDHDELKFSLNTDLKTVFKWSKDWLTTFSMPNTKFMFISDRFNIRPPVVKFNHIDEWSK
jgi:hypothetical protein